MLRSTLPIHSENDLRNTLKVSATIRKSQRLDPRRSSSSASRAVLRCIEARNPPSNAASAKNDFASGQENGRILVKIPRTLRSRIGGSMWETDPIKTPKTLAARRLLSTTRLFRPIASETVRPDASKPFRLQARKPLPGSVSLCPLWSVGCVACGGWWRISPSTTSKN